MEIKKKQIISNELLEPTIFVCLRVQVLMTELKPMFNTIIGIMHKIAEKDEGPFKAFETVKWLKVYKSEGKLHYSIPKDVIGHRHSTWREVIEKLTKQLKAIRNSDTEAQEQFESDLLGLIDDVGNLNKFLVVGIYIATASPEIISVEAEMYSRMLKFQAHVDTLHLLLGKILMEEKGEKRRCIIS